MSEHVEVLERLRGVLEHGRMEGKRLISTDLVEKAIAALSAPAEAQPVAWFPTNDKGEIIRNYGDGSSMYAYKTREAAERVKRLHLGAQGPVIPLFAAPQPPADQPDPIGDIKAALEGREGWHDLTAKVQRKGDTLLIDGLCVQPASEVKSGWCPTCGIWRPIGSGERQKGEWS